MTVGTLRRHRNGIVDFHNAYIAYFDAGPRGDPKLRMALVELIPAAQSAMNAAGVKPVIYPPLAVGGPVLSGLGNLTFAHELPGFRLTPVHQNMLDWCQITAAYLDERIAALRRRRRNPLYWIDMVLRGLLGIPAYLISLLFRVPFERVDASPVGPLLRLLSAASQGAGVYFGGREAGWW